MSRMMNSIEIGFWNALMPIRRRKANPPSREEPLAFCPDAVRLAFLTQSIWCTPWSQYAPLLTEVSPLELQSFQPTVRVTVREKSTLCV